MNLWSRRPADALVTALDGCDGWVGGVWSDNAGIDERADPQPFADELAAARRQRGWDGLYFGGVAFKYQREVAFADLSTVAARAAPYMDVICTSGPGTGQAADAGKPRACPERPYPGLNNSGDPGWLLSGCRPESAMSGRHLDTHSRHRLERAL